MLVRAPCTFVFILAVCCWVRHNAAVPLALHSSKQMQNAFKEEKTDSQSDLDDSTSNSRSMRDTETSDVASNETDENSENDEDEIQNKMRNQNINKNVNVNIFGDKRHRIKHNRDQRHKQSTTENIMKLAGQRTLEEIVKEEVSTNCASGNKKNQRYSSSFSTNTTNPNDALTVEKEFHDVVGNNSKVKKSSSIHEGEDITLCWIETTTIKEDKTFRPSKRLVIREYTISFENSATIPERYLECKRFEGELTADDPDIGKTALFEIIDEDTMVSRIVNFTSVSHIGNIIIWQHKKVKCGVGPVVSKNIIELNDGSKNPKKRVEIKVSPKMHQLTATTTDEECTESSTLTESITEYTTGLPCENGACEATMTSPSILSKTDKLTTEKIITELQSASDSEEDHLSTVTKSLTLPEAVSRRSTTFPKPPTTIQEKIDCEENPLDPACLTQEHDTSSSEELFTELLTTTEEAVAKTSLISEKTSEEEIFHPSDESKETTESISREEEEITSDLVTEETTPFATDIFMESSEKYVPQSTDQAPVDTKLETKITTSGSAEVVEEYLKSEEEGSSESSTVLTSEELGTVSSSSEEIVTSGEVDIGSDIITAMSPEYTEFTKPGKPGQIFDKLTESPISTESIKPVIIESLSTSEEVTSEESKEIRSASEETTLVGLKTSSTKKEKEFISTTTMLPMKIKSTLPVTSDEVSYTCENSEDCVSSEACDEFGNCGKMTTKCDSEVCSEEKITEGQKPQSKFDTSPSPRLTKVPPSATDLQSSEESAIMEHTTVINIATTMLTSQESENRTMTGHITMDTRRSTTTSTPRHKLALKVKVLLEHINENKEKHNLVEVEKHLSLDENPEHHLNPDLFQQLKSLNDSVNMETIGALLNCTSLGNLTKYSNFVKEPDVLDGSDSELEFTNDLEDSISDQFTSESDAKADYSEYEEHEIPSRKRRSLDDKIEDLNRFVRQNLYDPIESVVNTTNISQTQRTELIKDNLQLSTTNHVEEETISNNYTESERNVTKQEDQSTILSTISLSDIDFSNTSESHDGNVTKDNIQLTTTTYTPEEETSNVYIEGEKNITNEKNESMVPSIREKINNGTKMEIVRETLPGIQEDIMNGLQHMVSQLTQNNLTSINNIKEAITTNLLGILADPTDNRVHSRRKRAATEKVGHWSNERINKAPMGGNLRSFTEFTMYKVLS